MVFFLPAASGIGVGIAAIIFALFGGISLFQNMQTIFIVIGLIVGGFIILRLFK